jgi:hypothetical protein
MKRKTITLIAEVSPADYPNSCGCVRETAAGLNHPPPTHVGGHKRITATVWVVWQAESGFKYGVESSPDLLTNRWTPVTLPTGSMVTAGGNRHHCAAGGAAVAGVVPSQA